MKIGDAVWYVDPIGTQRAALLTAVHGGDSTPCVNLVFVSGDEERHDSYGRQIERESSVVHESNQSAHGNFWRHSLFDPR